MTKKKARKSLNPMYIPKQRREYVDYDYANKLNDSEKEFLSKFTDEFYGAGFEINPTFIKIDDETIKKLKDPKEKEWAATQPQNEFIQINFRDLRKYRSVQKYYKNTEGEFTEDVRFKYSESNLHKTPEQQALCNEESKSRDRDISSKGIKLDGGDNSSLIDTEDIVRIEQLSPEDVLLLKESIKINADINNTTIEKEISSEHESQKSKKDVK